VRWANNWRGLNERWVLRHPKGVIIALLLLFAAFGYGLKGFRLDASGDDLVLERDPDLQRYRRSVYLYETGDYIVITYSPQEDLFSAPSLARLRRLRDELKALPGVASVVTPLDVPLLMNKPGPLNELKQNLRTIESEDVDMPRAVAEFRTSPIYRHMLVSEDLRSAVVQVNFDVGEANRPMLTRRSELVERLHEKGVTAAEREEFQRLDTEYRAYRDRDRAQRHEDITRIRAVVEKYRADAQFNMGGVPILIDDIIAYIRNDLKVFGAGMVALLSGTLYVVFRRARWVLLPMACCLSSVFVMMGILGLMKWDVTVVSSNFISLQLILTLALLTHLVGRYVELLSLRPDAPHVDIVRDAVGDVFVPALHCQSTTIVGFASLMVCGILPIVNFGWMMSAGLIVSMAITFLLLPAGMVLLPKPANGAREFAFGRPLTSLCARLVAGHRRTILFVASVITVAIAVGCTRLQVENSFINYFRKSSEIYRGMKFVDTNMGGTTPLDITIDLREEQAAPAAKAGGQDADFEMFGEFEQQEQDPSKYWFTTHRLETVERVHDYLESQPEIGKVLSLATVWKQARNLNGGRTLDDFEAAILFNSLKGSFRDLLVRPYVSVEDGQARVAMRIKDSLKSLRRAALLKRVRTDLVQKVGLKEGQFRLGGLMVLYNNMLQSLFDSQVKTIAWTLLPLAAMFYLFFRTVRRTLVALIPSIISTASVLGFMGLAGIPLDMMTITVVAVGLGMAVDNGMHYLHRFGHEVELDWDYVAAMHRCHATVGNNMFYASLPVIIGYATLVMSNFVPTMLFGLLVAFAMTLCLASDLLLLPAIVLVFKPFGTGPTGTRPASAPHGGSRLPGATRVG
jgi:predicted RND superfamily exporter protein